MTLRPASALVSLVLLLCGLVSCSSEPAPQTGNSAPAPPKVSKPSGPVMTAR